MSDTDDSLDPLRHTPAGWSLEEELKNRGRGPGSRSERASRGRSRPERRGDGRAIRRLLGFDIRWA